MQRIIFTQEEFDNFPIVEGYRQCPSGDYTNIKSFPDNCSFGNRCSFGNYCPFGNRCSFGNSCSFGNNCSFERKQAKPGQPFISFTGAGSRKGSTVYFFNFEEGIYVRCGCFFGGIDEFTERVKERKADETYLFLAEIAKNKFS